MATKRPPGMALLAAETESDTTVRRGTKEAKMIPLKKIHDKINSTWFLKKPNSVEDTGRHPKLTTWGSTAAAQSAVKQDVAPPGSPRSREPTAAREADHIGWARAQRPEGFRDFSSPTRETLVHCPELSEGLRTWEGMTN